VTKLDAVNYILTRNGEGPVSALDTGGSGSAARAERTLDQAEWEVQAEGWRYNSRENVELVPDSNGKIAIPFGAFHIDATGDSESVNVVQDGDYLFDQTNNTDVFEDNVIVSYTLRMDWCHIPPMIRRLIAASASERYNEQHGRAPEKYRRQIDLAQNTLRVRLSAERDESDTGDVNILRSPDALRLKGRIRAGGKRDENYA
jgi:hypothetical protein